MTAKEKTNRKTAAAVGTLFLIAMAASLVGAGLIETALTGPDFLTAVSENETQLQIGVLLEMINGIAVVGIAVLMYPIFKRYSDSTALGYVGFRLMEAVFITVAAVAPLSLLPLSQEYLAAGASAAPYFQPAGSLLVAERATAAGLLIPVFFSLSAVLFYYLMYQSELVPRFISLWGFIGVASIVTLNLLDEGIGPLFVLALPIILNEIFLGIWLMVKGFNASAFVSPSAMPATGEAV